VVTEVHQLMRRHAVNELLIHWGVFRYVLVHFDALLQLRRDFFKQGGGTVVGEGKEVVFGHHDTWLSQNSQLPSPAHFQNGKCQASAAF
jgi:hypothetical protein